MTARSADVVVVGGGPAGVAAAVALRRQGVGTVVLVEREARLGGATRHCGHSPFGMLEFGRPYFGAAYGRRLEAAATEAGVDVRTGHSVVRIEGGGRILVTSDKGVETLAARRIVLSTGAREKPRSARLVSGDRPVGILTTGALQAYAALHGLMPFRRPVIVGTELVAYSAVLTCLLHGARPVAMIEPSPRPVARTVFSLFPEIVGVPLRRNTEILDILGSARVEAVRLRSPAGIETLACDGVLFTGEFVPEAALALQSPLGIDRGSSGPAIDQDGRTLDPVCFAAGNVLRAIETGGWAFREGRSVGNAVAADLAREPLAETPLRVGYDDPVKLVVPSFLRAGARSGALGERFQLRFSRCARGRLSLEIDGREVWRCSGRWLPERRVLVPIPPNAATAGSVRFRFEDEG